jgi:hypothetical protein
MYQFPLVPVAAVGAIVPVRMIPDEEAREETTFT